MRVVLKNVSTRKIERVPTDNGGTWESVPPNGTVLVPVSLAKKLLAHWYWQLESASEQARVELGLAPKALEEELSFLDEKVVKPYQAKKRNQK